MDISTFAILMSYLKKIVKEMGYIGFKVQVEKSREILERQGEEKIFYFIPKNISQSNNSYEEYIYVNNSWEKIGETEIDLSEYALKADIYTKEEIMGYRLSFETGYIKTNTAPVNLTPVANDNCRCCVTETKEGNKFYITVKGGNTAASWAFLDKDRQIIEQASSTMVEGVIVAPANSAYLVVNDQNTNKDCYKITIRDFYIDENSTNENFPTSKAVFDLIQDEAPSASVSPIENGAKITVKNRNGVSSVDVFNGKDGKGISNVAVDDENHLIVTLSDGSIIDAGSVVPETTSDQGVFGVVYDYSLVSPVLERLTKQTDPLHLVTKTVATEPTACIGTEGGQSEFDNFFPWKGIERKNCVNGEIVDFVGYDNGETYVYIPEFWFKAVDDLEHSKTYFYISSEEKEGFEKHAGSGRYIGRYLCNSDYKSISGGSPKNRMSPSQFRTNISSIDNNHFQWDIHSYSAICLLYIVEFANLNSQLMVGEGNTSYKNLQNSGQTDILIYHTGRVAGENADSAVQYRWIENLWGNYANFIDGVLLQNKEVYYCPNVSNYSDTITENYIDTQTLVDTGYSGKISTFSGCIIPTNPIINSSSSMGVCDYNLINGDLQAVQVGGNISNINGNAGLFTWQSITTTATPSYSSSRPMIIVGGDL